MNSRTLLKIARFPFVALFVAIALPFILAAAILFEDRGSDVEPE